MESGVTHKEGRGAVGYAKFTRELLHFRRGLKVHGVSFSGALRVREK